MKKRKYKSVINKRIFRSIKKIGLALTVLLVMISFEKMPNTNAFFADSDSAGGSSVSAGWWVLPTVEATNPEDGDVWQAGSSHSITWSADSTDPTATAGMGIDIDYACDGNLWTNIATGTANDGFQSWTVPEDISNNCKIKITATDSHGLSNSDESGQFEISWMVALNEFLPNPPGDESGPKPGGEWVELYNFGDEDVNVGGWHLYDALDHDLPINSSNTDTGDTIVASHDWLVVYRDGDSDFSLNNGGDTVKLYDDSIGSGGNEIDSTAYGAATEGKTIARVPDGIGPWIDPVPTPGKKNTDSNNIERFQKYYRERCIKDDGSVDEKDPVCDIEFLTELGVIAVKAEEIVPVTETITDPVIDPVTDPIIDSATDPIVDPIINPIADPATKPMVDPIIDPITDPVIDPVIDPVVDPITDPIIDSATDPIGDPITEPAEEEKSKIEAKEKEKIEAEEKAKAEAEEKARIEAEEKAEAEAEAKAKAEAETKTEAEEKAKIEEEKADKEEVEEESAKKEEKQDEEAKEETISNE